ncbi:MAG: hypothetical protein HY075_07845, partial [Deltaproteobacteria bacterium]|nr:hypothetical protein [Deltaproteobacteria bacterium]
MWMHSPFVDLALIGYSWVPLYLVYAFLALALPGFVCDAESQLACPAAVQALIALTLFVNRMHRHYSLGLAYGDREVFARHRAIFVWTPVVALLLVAPGVAYHALPYGSARTALVAFYSLVTAVSGVWQVYHTIMQKYGFLRIYSSKLGHGEARVERHLFFSWLAVVIAGSAFRYAGMGARIISYGPPEIQFLTRWLPYLKPASLALLAPALGYAGWFTWKWLSCELENYRPESIPKLLFALSVALIMACFAHSLLVGVLVLGFSHAFEYSVFVNVYAQRKYGVKLGATFLGNALLVALMLGLTNVFAHGSVRPWGLLIAYAVFTGLLHFLYDGLLWKVSRGKILLLAIASCAALSA